jgi:solute:Na+ symporter, SSS family
VQRYLLAPTDKKAFRGIAYGAVQTAAIWTLFMTIGTCTWAFYQLTGERLPAHITKADQVFPYFLATHLPLGVSGVFMAALMAAAMSTLSSDLNCLAAVGVEDVYRRLRPAAPDRQRLRMGKQMVAVFGVLGVLMALALAHSKGGALSLWFSISAILSGGLAGLFFLAFLTKRAHRQGVYVGIAAAVAFTTWASLTAGKGKLLNLGGWNYGWHEQTIGAVAHVVLFVVGYLASLAIAGPTDGKTVPTLWEWLRQGGRYSLRGRAGAG